MNKHLSLRPKSVRAGDNFRVVDDCVWYYEDSGGLRVCIQGAGGVQVVIPWRQIRSALKRKERP